MAILAGGGGAHPEGEEPLERERRDELAALHIFSAVTREHRRLIIEAHEARRRAYLQLHQEAAAAACGT